MTMLDKKIKEFRQGLKKNCPKRPSVFYTKKYIYTFIRELNIRNGNCLDPRSYYDWFLKKEREKETNKQLREQGKYFEYYNYRSLIIKSNKIIKTPFYFYLGKHDKQYLSWRPSEKINCFNKKQLLGDFLDLNLEKLIEKDSRKRVLRFAEKYGASFINYPFLFNYKDGLENYFDYFKRQYLLFGKTLELIGKDKKFPYLIKEPKLANRNYWKWYNKYASLLFELDKYGIFLKLAHPPILKALHKRSKKKIEFIGDRYPYLINLLYDYIFKNNDSIKKCGYCNKIFIPKNKKQNCCSPIHSKRTRNQRYKDKKKMEKV